MATVQELEARIKALEAKLDAHEKDTSEPHRAAGYPKWQQFLDVKAQQEVLAHAVGLPKKLGKPELHADYSKATATSFVVSWPNIVGVDRKRGNHGYEIAAWSAPGQNPANQPSVGAVTVGAERTEVTVTGGEAGTRYTVRVQALGIAGYTTDSDDASTEATTRR